MPKQDLIFQVPLLNAAGSLGFRPDPNGPIALDRLGGFITNPTSLTPRAPAGDRRLLRFPGGFLLHTGHPNPGLRAVLQSHGLYWARAPVPVLVHLLGEAPAAIADAVQWLEEAEGVAGIELSLSPGETAAGIAACLQAAMGELPIVLQLPLDRIKELKGSAADTGVAALSIGPPRGVLLGPGGARIQGRLYGPALLPLALAAVEACSNLGIPLIAGCGVYSQADVQACLEAGAAAVQLDSVLWKGVWGS